MDVEISVGWFWKKLALTFTECNIRPAMKLMRFLYKWLLSKYNQNWVKDVLSEWTVYQY